MARTLPAYLHTHRKRWALTQRELGILLGGIKRSTIGKVERFTRQPSREALIGCEYIFNTKAEEIFSALVGSVRTAVVLNAKTLYETLKAKTDPRSMRKKELLQSIIKKGQADDDL